MISFYHKVERHKLSDRILNNMTTTTTEMTTNTCVEMTTPVINLQTPVGKEKPLAAKYKNYTKFAYWFMKRLQTEEIIGESQVGDAVKALGVYLKSTKDKQIIFDDFENDAKQLDAELKQMVKIHENPNYKPRKRAPKKAKVDEEPVKDTTVKENMTCVVKELQEVIKEAVEEPVKEFVEETIQQVIEEQDEDQLEEAVEDQVEEQVEEAVEEQVEEQLEEAVEEQVIEEKKVEGTPPKKERKKSSKKKKIIVVQDDIVAQIVEAANACRIDASEPKVKKPRKKTVSVGDEALIEEEKSTDQVPKTLDDVADDVVTPELELEEYVK